MTVSPGMKKWILFYWILLVPPGLVLTYYVSPPPAGLNAIDVIGFLVLSAIVASMPMVINGVPIFLIQWVSIAIFLRYGLFIEMITIQLSILVLMLKLRIPREGMFRLPLNSSMFFVVSLLSGMAYYALGGTVTPNFKEGLGPFWLGLAYAIIYYVLNQLIVMLHQRVIYRTKDSLFGKDFIWETVSSVITLPLGFVLYMLHKDLGLLALFFIGGPFVSVSLILKMYDSTQHVNEYLQKAAEIGHQLAERVNVDEVTDLFLQKLSEMLPVDYAYVLEIQDNDDIYLARRVENGIVMPNSHLGLKKHQGISGTVWGTGKPVLFGSRKEWRHIVSANIPADAESILGIPMMKNGKIVGVVVLASRRKRAYEKSQLMIVDILCSHYAIAAENARHYEQAKEESERCSLTKLHNYRYFEKVLYREFGMLEKNVRERLALIILDIDHFKAVNDTYGHQSGNEVLKELSSRIQNIVGDSGTVARYGGEEFVILLPEVTSREAYNLAELIRESIANWPFILAQHLEGHGHKLSIKITASFGIATAPEDAEDPLALIRHADRALYVGAKRAGRNRVAAYVK
ncbi:sensor domain-containing diguanylate cyclase [Bacillus sp. FJAT-27245]|uniref:sensor domain-containing diguanylate cyclase n=1 Tax=Bacillus sp. FJAT-27245 TaxID=1684144 RepID=UPI000AB31EC3|nr:sensor domain-containing diguanylate cyclase [Bacillus sp. FJAT-27245]